ncbi:MAG TPA: type II secretion system F family protein, partial [Elusimicrobiales bacterium]|nr:type II secretion system F family protein [Elusimicrobiales bacterium]
LFISSGLVFHVLQVLFTPPKKDEASVTEMVQGSKETSAFAKLDPEGNLIDRLDLFLLKTFNLGPQLELMHLMMGSPEKPNPLDMLHIKEAAALGLPLFFIATFHSAIPIILLPIGFIVPDSIWRSKISKRQEDILANFSSFVDLAALTIESGLDYMTAFDRITKLVSKKSALESEIEKTINEVQLGYGRRDALQRLAVRSGLQEIRSFVGLIIQSDELGTSLVDLLRNFSADMRFRRINKAEKLAAQAATKMLIPMFFFIFPTVFILMLSPLIADLFAGGGLKL